MGFVNPAYTPSEVVNCRNSGGVSATDANADAIVGQYFGFSVLTLKADRAPFTVANCINTGTVTAQGGVIGGIMSNLFTDSEAERVYIRSCCRPAQAWARQRCRTFAPSVSRKPKRS